MSRILYISLKTRDFAPLPQEMRGIGVADHNVSIASLPKDRQDAIRRDAIVAQGKVLRADSGPDLGAFALALTKREREVIDEPAPPTHAMELFRMYSCEPGDAEYTTPYRQRTGEAAVYSTGTAIPMINASGFEVKAPIVHLVCGWERSYFKDQEAAASIRNIGMAVSTQADIMRDARTIMAEKANNIWWNGIPELGVFGVLNYPTVARRTLPTAIGPSSAPVDISNDVIALADYAIIASMQTYQPNRLVMSPRMARYLMKTPMSGIDVRITIGAFIEQATRMKIEEIWELQDIGGATGYDGVLAYNDNVQNTAIVQAQGFTLHQPYLIGLTTVQPCSMSIGGCRMALAGTNTLGIADCRAIQVP